MIDWLKSIQALPNFDTIEKDLGIPQGTLSKAVKGKRKLPKKWVQPLQEIKHKLNT